MLCRLDIWLIGRVEKSSHAFQRLTGRTNFWLFGRLCLFVVLVLLRCMVVQVMTGIKEGDLGVNDGGIGIFIFAVWFMSLLYRGIFQWQSLESEAWSRLERGLANPEKHIALHRYLRLFWVTFFPLNLFTLFFDYRAYRLIWIVIPFVYYLEACDPLPPCNGKVREWLDAFGKTPELATEGAR